MTSCLGVCGVAPAMMVNDRVYGNLTPELIAEVIAGLAEGKMSIYRTHILLPVDEGTVQAGVFEVKRRLESELTDEKTAEGNKGSGKRQRRHRRQGRHPGRVPRPYLLFPA